MIVRCEGSVILKQYIPKKHTSFGINFTSYVILRVISQHMILLCVEAELGNVELPRWQVPVQLEPGWKLGTQVVCRQFIFRVILWYAYWDNERLCDCWAKWNSDSYEYWTENDAEAEWHRDWGDLKHGSHGVERQKCKHSDKLAFYTSIR